jgi:hypothetical protein
MPTSFDIAQAMISRTREENRRIGRLLESVSAAARVDVPGGNIASTAQAYLLGRQEALVILSNSMALAGGVPVSPFMQQVEDDANVRLGVYETLFSRGGAGRPKVPDPGHSEGGSSAADGREEVGAA